MQFEGDHQMMSKKKKNRDAQRSGVTESQQVDSSVVLKTDERSTAWQQLKNNSLGLGFGLLIGVIATYLDSSYKLKAAQTLVSFFLVLLWLVTRYTKIWQRSVSASIVVVVAFGVWNFLLHPTVQSLQCEALSPRRPSDLTGNVYAGILWRDTFRQVKVSVTNESTFDATDLDLRVDTGEWLIEVGQPPGAIPCEVVPDTQEGFQVVTPPTVTFGTGESSKTYSLDNNSPVAFQLNTISAPGFKRVICAKLPRHSSTTLVLAVAGLGHDRPSLNKLGVDEVSLRGNYTAANRSIRIDQIVRTKRIL